MNASAIHRYGLLGHPLTHSASPAFFNERFKAQNKPHRYALLDLPTLAQFATWLTQQKHLAGFNVTTPYKRAIIAHLTELSPLAKRIGAVNTVLRTPTGWKGYNTDYDAFLQSMSLLPKHCTEHPALVLGTGGAARAVMAALADLQISCTAVSRQPKSKVISYDHLLKNPLHIQQYHLIVQATPVGMAPAIHQAPQLPYAQLNAQHICYDLIYNPKQTTFLRKADKQGCLTLNGEAMFKAQAEATWRIWGC